MNKENENFEIDFSPEIQSLSYFAHIPYTPVSTGAEFVDNSLQVILTMTKNYTKFIPQVGNFE